MLRVSRQLYHVARATSKTHLPSLSTPFIHFSTAAPTRSKIKHRASTTIEQNQSALELQLEKSMGFDAIEEETDEDSEKLEEYGHVIEKQRFLCTVTGLRRAHVGAMVLFNPPSESEPHPTVIPGMVLNMHKDTVTVAVLSPNMAGIEVGSDVELLSSENSHLLPHTGLPIGPALKGRVVDPLGKPLDGLHDFAEDDIAEQPLSSTLPWSSSTSVLAQSRIQRAFPTGLRMIDCLQPLGHGHRLAILGKSGTGKSLTAIDIIQRVGKISQREGERPIACVYVAIGKSPQRLAQINQLLQDCGAMDYTTVVATSQNDALPLQYIAPFCGSEVAQYYQNNGQDALVIYDDLMTHAKVTNDITENLRLPSSKKVAQTANAAYSFMLPNHTSLLERAAQLSKFKGGGALTAIALAEVEESPQTGTISAFTESLISSTDDWISLDSELHWSRTYPPINSISAKAQSSSWSGISMGNIVGTKSIRGPPFQSKAYWNVMNQLQSMLLSSRQTYLNIQMAREFGFEPEADDAEMLQWAELVQSLWCQRPLEENSTSPAQVLFVSYLLIAKRGLLLSHFYDKSKEDEQNSFLTKEITIWPLMNDAWDNFCCDHPASAAQLEELTSITSSASGIPTELGQVMQHSLTHAVKSFVPPAW